MYIGHSRLCVCVSLAISPYYCTDPDISWENGRGCPLVVHYWVDLQPVHELHCYENIVPNAKRQQVVVLALCPVEISDHAEPNRFQSETFTVVWQTSGLQHLCYT